VVVVQQMLIVPLVTYHHVLEKKVRLMALIMDSFPSQNFLMVLISTMIKILNVKIRTTMMMMMMTLLFFLHLYQHHYQLQFLLLFPFPLIMNKMNKTMILLIHLTRVVPVCGLFFLVQLVSSLLVVVSFFFQRRKA